nr:hypothetical protein [Pantoea ananatis]
MFFPHWIAGECKHPEKTICYCKHTRFSSTHFLKFPRF